MKRLGFVVLLLLMAAPALAINQPFDTSILNVGNQSPDIVYQRYWTAAKPNVSPTCASTCGASGSNCVTELGYSWCKLLAWNSSKTAYRGYQENPANFGDAPEATIFSSVFDLQKNAGTANHAGYLAWTRDDIRFGDTELFYALDCVGTVTQGCLGNATDANATDLPTGVPLGALNSLGGLSPIPVPKATDLNSDGKAYASGNFELDWYDVATPGRPRVASAQASGYEVYAWVADGTVSCPGYPSETAFPGTPVKTVRGASQTTVTAAELGVSQGDLDAGRCVVFALKVIWEPPFTPDGVMHKTRYLSANGQMFWTKQGAAVTLYDLQARLVRSRTPRNTPVEVSWKVSLEEGVQQYNVFRATSESGPFSLVGSVPADGSSAYNFVDRTGMGAPQALRLWYKVEAIDIDNQATPYGPVKVQVR